jgi:hypothetical protein
VSNRGVDVEVLAKKMGLLFKRFDFWSCFGVEKEKLLIIHLHQFAVEVILKS